MYLDDTMSSLVCSCNGVAAQPMQLKSCTCGSCMCVLLAKRLFCCDQLLVGSSESAAEELQLTAKGNQLSAKANELSAKDKQAAAAHAEKVLRVDELQHMQQQVTGLQRQPGADEVHLPINLVA